MKRRLSPPDAISLAVALDLTSLRDHGEVTRPAPNWRPNREDQAIYYHAAP